ncbi:ECF transporter S component [Oscillospiraceae bacterium LTW-04]|nr:ECF transporter S component [Oscillospiraceae bacterium MB24-C1]
MKTTVKVRRVTVTAMFAALASILMFFETPIPFMPPFLKLDPSAIPILIGGFILGPMASVAMVFIKAFVHFFSSTTGGVGELADFIMTSSFVVIAAIVYRRHHTKKGAVLACISGTVALAVVGVLANKLLVLPFYSTVMPIEAIFKACAAVNPLIKDTNTYLMYGVLPFNLIKGIVISLITFPVYKRMSNHIKHFIAMVEPASGAIKSIPSKQS